MVSANFRTDGPLHWCQDSGMNKKTAAPAKATRKKGPDRNEDATKQKPLDKNFKQSRDIHEDRGTVQRKTGSATRTTR